MPCLYPETFKLLFLLFYCLLNQVAQLPTPIHKWSLPGVKDKFEVFIKRDDLTGAALSGNKVS